MKNESKLAISLFIPLLVSFSAGYFTVSGSGSWYQAIEKPVWTPPPTLFAPVWTVLYILMGIALYLVWKSNALLPVKRKAISLWALQLSLNFLWSVLFFQLHQIAWAFVEITVLWLAILFTILLFSRINKWAGWLLFPYLLWVGFAVFLTYSIWRLNS